MSTVRRTSNPVRSKVKQRLLEAQSILYSVFFTLCSRSFGGGWVDSFNLINKYTHVLQVAVSFSQCPPFLYFWHTILNILT